MIHRTQYANVREMLSMVAVTLSHTEDPINGSYLVPNTVFITSCLLVFLFLIYVFKGEVIFPHFTYKKLRLRVPLVNGKSRIMAHVCLELKSILYSVLLLSKQIN